MMGRLNHVAIAVRDAEQAAKIYGKAFGADISAAVPLPEHGVITVFVTLPNTKLEFIQPLGKTSPIEKFLERNADGGIQHICYDVPDINAARDRLIMDGVAVLVDGHQQIGGSGRRRNPASRGWSAPALSHLPARGLRSGTSILFPDVRGTGARKPAASDPRNAPPPVQNCGGAGWPMPSCPLGSNELESRF